MLKRVVHHIIISGHSGDSGSLLEKLNQSERRQLDEWARTQQPRENGGIDLMRWPGWAEAAHRMQSDMQIARGQALDIIDRVKSRGIK